MGEEIHPSTLPASGQTLSALGRGALLIGAIVDLILGLAFMFGPESGATLWPTPVPPVLMRFIGAIILANAAGAWLAARQGTWEGARSLFVVALVYGAAVLIALLYHLLLQNASPIFWAYAVVDGVFLVPIVYIWLGHERSRIRPS